MVKQLFYVVIATSFAISTNVTAEQLSVKNIHDTKQHTLVQDSTVKSELMSLLASIDNLSAKFVQDIVDVDGELLQQGAVRFVLAKPNLLRWNTTEPDESMIVSDGQNIWLFDPFIEQATVYPLNKSIANTPILLLTSTNEELWQEYRIVKDNERQYQVNSINDEAQVKQLILTFENKNLASFVIVDATGQQSKFKLTEIQNNQILSEGLFKFDVPEGILIDDQR